MNIIHGGEGDCFDVLPLCGECDKPVFNGEPWAIYDGEKCHLHCAAEAMDNECWDIDYD